MRVSQAMPATASERPASSTAVLPKRAIRRGTTRPIVNITAVIGRKASPAWSGLKPFTPCRNWVRKKNVENMPPTTSNRAT